MTTKNNCFYNCCVPVAVICPPNGEAAGFWPKIPPEVAAVVLPNIELPVWLFPPNTMEKEEMKHFFAKTVSELKELINLVSSVYPRIFITFPFTIGQMNAKALNLLYKAMPGFKLKTRIRQLLSNRPHPNLQSNKWKYETVF